MTKPIYCDRHRADHMTSCPRCAEEKIVELEELVAELKAAEGILHQTISRQRGLLGEVANSGVEFEDDRVRYVTVQIDRDTWDDLQLWFAK